MRVYGLGLVCALAACGSEAGAPAPSYSNEPTPSYSNQEHDAVAAPPPPELPPVAAAPAPTPPPKLGAPYPVLLMHGMGGFGKLSVGPIEVTYFNGVVEDLAKNGEAVYLVLAPPYASSEVRAEAVAKQIDAILLRTGKAKVNLIGHSQGGIDARVVASPNGLHYGDRVASVTTVASPHRGSRIADAMLGTLKHLPQKDVDRVTGAILSLLEKTAYELQTEPALREQLVGLSETYMRDVFNPRYTDDPGVVYKSYAGRSNNHKGISACEGSVYPNVPSKVDSVTPSLFATAVFLEEGGGKANDGMVTVDSSKWGTFEQCVPADHMKEVGQGGPGAGFDHVALFRDIVARLRSAGL